MSTTEQAVATKEVAKPATTAAVKTAPITVNSEVKMIDRGQIAVIQNVRKTFVKAEGDELVESIRMTRWVSPLLVRELPATIARPFEKGDPATTVAKFKSTSSAFPGKKFQLVAGERRFRATEVLGIQMLPCEVKVLDDREVLVLQLVENLQRADLNPVEEAEGYEQLIALGEYTPKELAVKLNKSTRYVYQRLKLSNLPDISREALRQGVLSLTQAREIACLPHAEWREEATKMVLNPKKHREEWADSGLIECYEEVPEEITSRMTMQLLQSRYMRELKGAPFDAKDATLVPAAGPCAVCPKRAGNARELFPDLREDMCTDLKCFGAKIQATQDRLSASAVAKGLKVLPAEEAKKLFQKRHDGGYGLSYNAAMVDVNEKPSFELVNNPNKAGAWKGLVKGKEVPIVVAFDGAGQMHELMERKLAVAAAKENKPALFRQRGGSSGNAETKKYKLEQERASRYNKLAFDDFIDQLVVKIEKAKLEDSFVRALLYTALDLDENYGGAALDAILTRRHVQFKEEDDQLKVLEKHLKGFGTPQSIAALAIEVLLTTDHLEGNSGGDVIFAQHYKLDLGKIRDKARDEVLHAMKAEEEKAKQAELAKKKAVKK